MRGVSQRRDLAALFVISLAVRLIVAACIRRPGYMDAAYYAAGAVNLAEGGGLHEPFLWNYLDDPAGIPHPGFLYWMPLPSLLAAPAAVLFPGSFFALQLPFVLLSALLPLVGYAVAWQIKGARGWAWLAGLLALFSGFFFPYWTLPETFAPYALFGSLALGLAGSRMQRGKVGGDWLAGALVGLAHLTRADGVLLLPVVLLAAVIAACSPRADESADRDPASAGLLLRSAPAILACCVWVLAGYLLVMGPWFVRNLSVIGAPLSSAGIKTLWLTTYDDLFCYGCDLSPRAYLAWGWENILRSKLWAGGVNLERFLAEDALIFMFPFVLLGFYRLRRHLASVLACVYLLLAYLFHSLLFTFPGPRGGFFHASAAALPFLLAAGVEGLSAAVDWAARRRRWNRRQAASVFSASVVVAAAALSLYAASLALPRWWGADMAYEEIGRWMDRHGVGCDVIVMANNPPALWYHARRPSVPVPAAGGGIEALLAAADRYQVAYVVLDRNGPLTAHGSPHPRLREAASWGEGASRVALYRVMAW